jgi:hypothetical protein
MHAFNLIAVVCSGRPHEPYLQGAALGTDAHPFPVSSQPRMYTNLAITGRRMLSSTEHPNRLILWQKHEYTVRVTGSKKVRPSDRTREFVTCKLIFGRLGGRVNLGHRP